MKDVGTHMMTIAEFADFCGTTKDTLRWYDRLGLLKPSQVGDNGYRYYDIVQYEEYDFIRILKETGSSLGEIGAILEDKQAWLNESFFSKRIALLDQQLHRLESMRSLVQGMFDGFLAMRTCCPKVPVLEDLEDAWLLQIPLEKTRERNEDDYVYSLAKLQQAVEEDERTPPYPVGIKLALLPSMNGELEQTHFYCRTRDASSPLAVFRAGGPAVSIWHRGLYEDIFSTLDIAFRYIRERGLRPCDAVYELDYLTSLSDKPENTTFLFTIPVARRSI